MQQIYFPQGEDFYNWFTIVETKQNFTSVSKDTLIYLSMVCKYVVVTVTLGEFKLSNVW